MEYTKDIIFNVRYADNVERIELKEKSWRKKMGQAVMRHKLISIIVFMTILLVGLDMALIVNFVELFSKL